MSDSGKTIQLLFVKSVLSVEKRLIKSPTFAGSIPIFMPVEIHIYLGKL